MTIALAAGVVGTVGFVVTFLADGLTRPGYSPVRHPVSALALGPRGWLQTTNFIVCGLLITVSALGVHDAMGSLLLAALIAVFGLALVASGVFPMDPMRGYPPGAPGDTPEHTSRRHQLHDWAGVVVFGAVPAIAAVTAFRLDGLWSLYSGSVAVASTVLFFWFGTAWEADSPRAGLIQRVTIILGWLWLGHLCWHLLATGS